MTTHITRLFVRSKGTFVLWNAFERDQRNEGPSLYRSGTMSRSLDPWGAVVPLEERMVRCHAKYDYPRYEPLSINNTGGETSKVIPRAGRRT